MNVPFLNLAAQYESLKAELLPAVEKALASGHYVLGPNVTALEHEVAAFTTARFGVGVNSGSDALTLALRALDIGPGDEVITAWVERWQTCLRAGGVDPPGRREAGLRRHPPAHVQH